METRFCLDATICDPKLVFADPNLNKPFSPRVTIAPTPTTLMQLLDAV